MIDGKVVSTFQRDQTLFRVISQHDLDMRHPQSLVIGLTSDWTFEGLAPTVITFGRRASWAPP
jgi:hypothetical protein